MPVRIFFRGLILFRFPADGTLVAELISEPENRPPVPGSRPDQDDHAAEIRVVTGGRVEELLPHGLPRGARVNITIPGCQGPVKRADNFNQFVPNIVELARMAKLPRLVSASRRQTRGKTKQVRAKTIETSQNYLRATVTVNCGTIRVKEVVMWDASGYPLPGTESNDAPTTPAEVKFCGVNLGGHAANECVVEIDGTDVVDISSPDLPQLKGPRPSSRRRNQLAQENTTDIRIHNYEYQRDRPVPWGLDFQWLFAHAGYGTVDLGGEVDEFASRAGVGDYAPLLQQDRASLLPTRDGRPFPYIVGDSALIRLTPLRPPTDIDSRPVCVPGRGG